MSYSFFSIFSFFFFNDTATTEIYTLSLHDALPIWCCAICCSSTAVSRASTAPSAFMAPIMARSEEHTSELQSRRDLVCRLLLEKKKKKKKRNKKSQKKQQKIKIKRTD